MKPDGKLIVEVIRPPSTARVMTIEYSFADIDWWRPDAFGLTVAVKAQLHTRRTCTPWHNIVSFDVLPNSQQYLNWVEEDPELRRFKDYVYNDTQRRNDPVFGYWPGAQALWSGGA